MTPANADHIAHSIPPAGVPSCSGCRLHCDNRQLTRRPWLISGNFPQATIHGFYPPANLLGVNGSPLQSALALPVRPRVGSAFYFNLRGFPSAAQSACGVGPASGSARRPTFLLPRVPVSRAVRPRRLHTPPRASGGAYFPSVACPLPDTAAAGPARRADVPSSAPVPFIQFATRAVRQPLTLVSSALRGSPAKTRAFQFHIVTNIAPAATNTAALKAAKASAPLSIVRPQ
jgi:hypothetical protein